MQGLCQRLQSTATTATAATDITACCPSHRQATLWRVKGRFLAKLDTPHPCRLDGLSRGSRFAQTQSATDDAASLTTWWSAPSFCDLEVAAQARCAVRGINTPEKRDPPPLPPNHVLTILVMRFVPCILNLCCTMRCARDHSGQLFRLSKIEG